MSIAELYNYYVHEIADPRVTKWFLMESFWAIPLILIIYLGFVFLLGPRYMKNRPAYDLTTFLKIYNIFQIISNAYLVKEILSVYPDATALRCVPGDWSMNPDALKLARTCYYITLLKIIDLVETGVFVLRKKQKQITILHLYHHISTLICAMIFTRYIAAGMLAFYPAMNCTVHVIMYTYYLLSSIKGPIADMFVPYKKYITIIQMVQFVFLLAHALVSLLPSCNVPKFPGIVGLPIVSLNFTLFYNFYKKTYMTSTEKKTKYK